jgi:competence ComEA-like helix-hairpin-helix protein
MENKRILFILILIISINFILADCVDINTASISELDEIKWVGPVTAENIVNSRPFESVDDLIKVSGIGDIKLQDIKDQGLACVQNQEENNEDPNDSEEENEENNTVILIQENNQEKEDKVMNPININPKDINTESYKQEQGNDYAFCGLIVFGIIIIILFLLKKNKYQNEFR